MTTISTQPESGTKAHRAPAWLAPVVIAVVIVALLGGAGAMVLATRSGDAATAGPATILMPVALGGGTLTVTKAVEPGDPMAAMQHVNQEGFARSGMSMKAMNPDPIPDGMRRIRVDIEVRALTGEVRFPAAGFTMVNGDGLGEPAKAHSTFLGDAFTSEGLVGTGNLQFDIPVGWTTPRLVVAGAAAPIVLTDVVPAKVEDHSAHGKGSDTTVPDTTAPASAGGGHGNHAHGGK